MPGYDWAPAWVAWRGGGDYYGWAPLSPGLNVSVGVSWGNQIPYDRWVFAPHRYITSANIGRYYVPRTQNVTIIKRTTIVNNTVVKNNVHFVAGPRRTDVERINHSRVQTYTVANSSRPGKTVVNNKTINVYRPIINKTTVNQNHNETVVNKNTTVNKNSNNTTVNKNSNNTTVNKNNNSTVKKTTVNKNNNNQTVKENDNNKTTVNNNSNKTVTKKQPQPKPQPKADNKQNNQPQANNNPEKNRQQVIKPNRNIDNKPQVTKRAPVLKPSTPSRPQPKASANNDNKKPDHQKK